MWTDAALENWRLRQRVELSRPWPKHDATSASSSPSAGNVSLLANPSPYERVQSGNGVVRFKLKPVEVVQLPIPALLGQGGRAVRVTP